MTLWTYRESVPGMWSVYFRSKAVVHYRNKDAEQRARAHVERMNSVVEAAGKGAKG